MQQPYCTYCVYCLLSIAYIFTYCFCILSYVWSSTARNYWRFFSSYFILYIFPLLYPSCAPLYHGNSLACGKLLGNKSDSEKTKKRSFLGHTGIISCSTTSGHWGKKNWYIHAARSRLCNSGSTWHVQCKMAALVFETFCLHFCTVGGGDVFYVIHIYVSDLTSNRIDAPVTSGRGDI